MSSFKVEPSSVCLTVPYYRDNDFTDLAILMTGTSHYAYGTNAGEENLPVNLVSFSGRKPWWRLRAVLQPL